MILESTAAHNTKYKNDLYLKIEYLNEAASKCDKISTGDKMTGKFFI